MFSVIISPSQVKEFWPELKKDSDQGVDEWISEARRGEKTIFGAQVIIKESIKEKGNYAAYRPNSGERRGFIAERPLQ